MKRFVSIPEHPKWRCEGKKPLVVKEKVRNKKEMLGLHTGVHYAVIGLKQAIIMISTVDGRNPAPVYRYFYPTIYRVSAPSQVVQDFSHQQYEPNQHVSRSYLLGVCSSGRDLPG